MISQHTHTTTTFNIKNFPIVLVCDGVQSPSNIGSLFRISDALGISEIIFCDAIINFNSPRLQKTARSTQKKVKYSESESIVTSIEHLKKKDYKIVALEITDTSIAIENFVLPKDQKVALVIGNEQKGISNEVLQNNPATVHIEMYGENSSMNVVQAATIALHSIINKSYIY